MNKKLLIITLALSVFSLFSGYHHAFSENTLGELYKLSLNTRFISKTEHTYHIKGLATILNNEYNAIYSLNNFPIRGISGKLEDFSDGKNRIRIVENQVDTFGHLGASSQAGLPPHISMYVLSESKSKKDIVLFRTPNDNFIWIIEGTMVYLVNNYNYQK